MSSWPFASPPTGVKLGIIPATGTAVAGRSRILGPWSRREGDHREADRGAHLEPALCPVRSHRTNRWLIPVYICIDMYGNETARMRRTGPATTEASGALDGLTYPARPRGSESRQDSAGMT